MSSSIAAGRALLGVLVAAALLVCPAAADTVKVVYGGRLYELETTGGGISPPVESNLNRTFWYSDPVAAKAACTQVNASLGAPNGFDVGPFFVYSMTPSNYSAYAYEVNTGDCLVFSGGSESFVYVLDTDMGPAPSPSPAPLDCSLAVFSPPILSSRVTSQICAASKAVRQGKQSKMVTNVTLSLLDANNQPASINITDIVTNKLTAGWQCRCRPTNRDNCTCLPNAWLLGGGNFLVFPQWRRSTRPGNIVDTTLQVSFTATAAGGDNCTGTAVICSAWGVRPNQPPPVCTPFNSTGVTRPALTCV